jgi:CheY-like chemotaxis protein/HPt (histidine-containing phosphotransfer) domain-containing protein/two-component sensor histidine kinase
MKAETEEGRLRAELVEAKERAEQSARLKSAFLATMSHEVRTPLNAVIGLMDLLRTRPLDTEAQELVSLAQSAGKDLLRIVSDILDFSKMEAGALELEASSFDLFQLVSRVVSTYRPNAQRKGLSLTLHVSANVQHWVSGDATRLAQVLGNLVSNAIKFTERGQITVTTKRKVNMLRFEVADTGISIPQSARASLFGAFKQADQSTTRRYGGTGLGLAIARGIVQRMGGSIDFESAAGRGTTFFFEIPYECGQDEGPESCVAFSTPPAQAPYAPRKSCGRILVAEDNAVNQRLLRGFLEHLGFTPEIVGDGALAVEGAQAKRFSALLIDWQMPGMDGLTAIRKIRELEAQGLSPRIPIVAVTAHALEGDREMCIAAGADDYLTKPIRLEALTTVLQRWIPDDKRVGLHTLNESALQQLLDAGGPDLLREVSEVYLEDAPSRLGRMREALRSGDTRELARQAHAVKGSSASVAASRMHSLAGDLEARARAGEVDVAARLLDELERELFPVSRALSSALARAQS